MTQDILQQTAEAIQEDWGLRLPDSFSEEALLQLLADRIVAVLERGPETFFQLMYRLDIPEKKLNMVMLQDSAAVKIAQLVYDRQLQKIHSRQTFKNNDGTEDPELKW